MKPPVAQRLEMRHLTRPLPAMAIQMMVSPVGTLPRLALRALLLVARPTLRSVRLILTPRRPTNEQRPQQDPTSKLERPATMGGRDITVS